MAGARHDRLSPARLEHAGLRTAQLDPMIDWYAKVLDAEISFRNAMMAFLRYDERNHRLVIIARPGTTPRPAGSAGLDHLAFAYETREQLAATYRRLRDAGIRPQRSTDHCSSLSLYYDDPDGNQIELKVDTFASDEEQIGWLSSDAFARNPTGAAFDPEELFEEG